MNMKYNGSLARLQKIVQDCGVFGVWRRLEQPRGYQFRSRNGEIMNWWPSTGTVYFQGRPGDLQPRIHALYMYQNTTNHDMLMISPRAIIR